MSLADAVKHVLSNYATFSGRARRSEFWFWALATFLVSLIAGLAESAVAPEFVIGIEGYSTVGPLTAIVALGLLLPNLAVMVRRLHDTSHSGWWAFIGIVPVIGPIGLLIFFVTDSHGANQYGPSPKALTGAPAHI